MFRDTLVNFVCGKAWMEADELSDDTALFSAGIIDSVDLLELVTLIENELSIKITPGQLTLEHFDSVGKILAFVEKLKKT